jgi:hypothetical protein
METEKQRRGWGHRLVAVFLLWLLFAQALGAARAASITFDEGPHLAVGYATLRTGDLRLQPVHIHPPLANMLAAAPLLLDPDLPDPRTIPGWEIASLSAITDSSIWQYPHPARLALAGRLPIILLTLLAGALVFRWAADLAGTGAGLLALGLCVLDPNVIAHGSLITTDMAVTAFGLLTFFLLSRYRHRPSRARLVGIGIALGLALASKVSALLLVPLVGVALVVGRGSRAVRRAQRMARARAWRRGVRAWLGVILVALGVLWAAYRFELRPLPAATHLEIYHSLQEHYRLGHAAFLMGQNSDMGWWFYFPVAFAIKTPLPTLILLGAALVIFVRRRQPADLTLILFPVVYLVTTLFSSVDIGYRHMLPILPFMYIFIASELRGARGEWRMANGALRVANHGLRITKHVSSFALLRTGCFTFYALLLWLALGTARVHPYPLTFFNELAGGPQGGYRWLVDSNLDWGQNLWQLRDWMEKQDVERVYYSHFSPARPEVYGVTADWLLPDPRAVPFAPFDPAPGVYAIGATTLQGVYTPDVNTYAWFRARQPDAVLGHALFIYRAPERPAPEWVAVCFGVPLEARQIQAGFGRADRAAHPEGGSRPGLRLVFYDCAQSQVYLAGNEGRYLLPPEADWPAGATLELEARDPDGSTLYRILRAGERPTPEKVTGVARLDGPLSFLGYQLGQVQVHPGQEVTLQTFWQVTQVPERPLSLMAHLIGADGTPIAVGDGLGVPIVGWQPGDIIVQRHALLVPQGIPPGLYAIQTGAYWLDTLERWPVHLDDGTTSDRLLLDKITILD